VDDGMMLTYTSGVGTAGSSGITLAMDLAVGVLSFVGTDVALT
jgi:hypothetical protein